MENRCRLCAELGTDVVNALDDIDLILRIFQLFNVKICLEDKLPSVICQLCLETVRQTWDFSQHVQRSQEILSEIVNSEQTTGDARLNYVSEELKHSDLLSLVKEEVQKPPQKVRNGQWWVAEQVS